MTSTQQPTLTATYTVCTTYEDVVAAISTLSGYPYTMLDCEGRSLGTTSGALSLLCLGTPAIAFQSIFIVDVPAILASHLARSAVVAFLIRADSIKVMWDGRMDEIELVETFGCRCGRVLDLQIVEVLARQSKFAEQDHVRLQRLARRTQFGKEVWKGRKKYQGLDVVLGMQAALREFKLDFGIEKDVEVVKMHSEGLSSRWMERPLSPKLFQYAANDIAILARLFSFFYNNGFIPTTPLKLEVVLDKCRRYVSRCNKQGRIVADDPLRPKAVLMIDSLSFSGTSAECAGCNMMLPHTCFSTTSGKKSKKKGSARNAYCRLCEVIAVREEIKLPVIS
ncbi:hypothetical protein BV25DRAFT_1812799 [Artomyces pyxidatus]|uniref:Uncharacterized protein n=1 Tax=Artomyces pyxidatus TaxID=48021 RepID=A0ACB8SLS5_9AGAM|nr:hypothetical protein BV25DRAFT_1812799 [Artomyces pyxidatus]